MLGQLLSELLVYFILQTTDPAPGGFNPSATKAPPALRNDTPEGAQRCRPRWLRLAYPASTALVHADPKLQNPREVIRFDAAVVAGIYLASCCDCCTSRQAQ